MYSCSIPGAIAGDATHISNSGDNAGPRLSRSDGKRDSAKDVAKSTLRSAGCTDPEALHISDSVIFVHCGLPSQIYAFAKAKPHARLRALEQATTRGITDLDGDAAGTILRVSDGTRVRSISLAQ